VLFQPKPRQARNVQTLPPLDTKCPFYSDVLCRIAMTVTQRGEPVPPGLIMYSRMLILIALRERSLQAMHAGTLLATAGLVPLDEVMLADEESATQSVFDAVRGEPWESLDCVQVGESAADWVASIMPMVPPEAQGPVKWVNALFSTGKETSGTFYEVRTTVKGAARYAELRESRRPHKAQDPQDPQEAKYVTSQRGSRKSELKMLEDRRQGEEKKASKQLHMIEFKAALQQAIEEQLRAPPLFDIPQGYSLQHTIPLTIMDRQGCVWEGLSEERTVMADNGGFCHTTRKLHSWRPGNAIAKEFAQRHQKAVRGDAGGPPGSMPAAQSKEDDTDPQAGGLVVAGAGRGLAEIEVELDTQSMVDDLDFLLEGIDFDLGLLTKLG